MSPEENKAVLRRYIEEAWGAGRLDVLDEVVATDAVFHDMVRQGLPSGREGVRASMRSFSEAFPDAVMEVQEILAEGDLVAFRWVSWGTHTGDLQGIPPTGRKGTLEGIVIARLRDGQVVEGWQEIDLMGLLQRLRILPKGGMPRPVLRAMFLAQRVGDRLRGRT